LVEESKLLGIAADFVLIILAGLLGGMLARLLKLPLLVGYVAAGVLVGPHTAGPTVVQVHFCCSLSALRSRFAISGLSEK
jgi:predicted Kef-type K+ transport protein